MFDVFYYPDGVGDRYLLHSAIGDGNKIISGTINEALNTVTTFTFSIPISNTFFGTIQPFKGAVQVFNRNTNREVFYGRVLKPSGDMNANGLVSQTYIAEDPLAYLNDSTQVYNRENYYSELFWLQELIYNHNLQVESHKQFKVGNVDVEDVEQPLRHYWGQDTTFNELKKRRDKVGGYITVVRDGDLWRIDWTKEVGERVETAIQLGKNMKSAKRTNAFENMITRLIPLGKETGTPWSDPDAVTQRVDISSVNNGIRYIDDVDLVQQFGVIAQPVIFDQIRTAQPLLDAGKTYLDEQHKYLTSWETDVADLSIIDPTQSPFLVGNTHPIKNELMSAVEYHQIVGKQTNILSPQNPKITLGSVERTISSYYNTVQSNIKALGNITQRKPDTEG